MTDRDRLIELMQKQFTELYRDGDWNFNEMIVGVADHLLANGVIVPPCKVGDTVFIIHTLTHPVIVKCVVDALHFSYGRTIRGQKRYSYALVREADLTFLSSRIYFENFGRTAFLTQKEAEAALKEREGKQ